MRRADRLFQIILLIGRGNMTAQRLANKLEVSERTIYRDVADLVSSGVPIEGAAGVGYQLRSGYQLPPLMFTPDELQALVLGIRMVQSSADPELGAAADNALSKIGALLNSAALPTFNRIGSGFIVPDVRVSSAMREPLALLGQAIAELRKLQFSYRRADGQPSQRVVQPLGLFYWGNSWTLAGWCELRDGFRTFRTDRISELQLLNQTFSPPLGRRLSDYLAAVCD